MTKMCLVRSTREYSVQSRCSVLRAEQNEKQERKNNTWVYILRTKSTQLSRGMLNLTKYATPRDDGEAPLECKLHLEACFYL
jgi:hypothetical protein